MTKDIWRTPYGAFHLRVVNVFARLFGVLSVIGGAGFVAWAVYFFLHPVLPSTARTVSGSAAFDYLGAGVLCLLMGVVFLTVRPYRPDMTIGTGSGSRRSWWTGEPR
jgi:hypothetical protein